MNTKLLVYLSLDYLLKKFLSILFLIFISCLITSCSKSPTKTNNDSDTSTSIIAPNNNTSTQIPTYTYKIINTYPHDRQAFTQGLVFEDNVLYEGTGLRGRSTLRRVELETGKILNIHVLPPQYFGEGVTIYEDKIYQLSWTSKVGFVYDKYSFNLIKEFYLSFEGWGITHDGERLIISDGTSLLHFFDPQTLLEINHIQIHDENGPVNRLNELEYIKGEIYANIWQTDNIAIISPETGKITGWINLQGLLDIKDIFGPVDVLNGIAYDDEMDRLFVTGKLWPKIFEIKLIFYP